MGKVRKTGRLVLLCGLGIGLVPMTAEAAYVVTVEDSIGDVNKQDVPQGGDISLSVVLTHDPAFVGQGTAFDTFRFGLGFDKSGTGNVGLEMTGYDMPPAVFVQLPSQTTASHPLLGLDLHRLAHPTERLALDQYARIAHRREIGPCTNRPPRAGPCM